MIAQPQRLSEPQQTLRSLAPPAAEATATAGTPASARWGKVGEMSLLDGQVQVFTSTHRHFFTHVLSQALRDAGQGTAVLIVQFFKGGIDRGPENPTHLSQNLDWIRCRLPYSINHAPQRAEEREAIRELWKFTQEAVRAERYEQVILEELSLAVFYGIVQEQEVLQLLADRPRFMDITLVGQQMSPALLQAANQVTELRNLFEIPCNAAPYPPPARPEAEFDSGPGVGSGARLNRPRSNGAAALAAEELSTPALVRAESSPGQICIPGLDELQ